MNTPSVLGQSFVDANFALLRAGFLIFPPTLVLNGASGSVALLMADNTLITADGLDRADSHAPLLTASFVIIQSPSPGKSYVPSLTSCAITAIGYSVPTFSGPIPVP